MRTWRKTGRAEGDTPVELTERDPATLEAGNTPPGRDDKLMPCPPTHTRGQTPGTPAQTRRR